MKKDKTEKINLREISGANATSAYNVTMRKRTSNQAVLVFLKKRKFSDF